MSNSVRAVWLKTTVSYARQQLGQGKINGEPHAAELPGSEPIEGLQVRQESRDWVLAVEKHRKAVADFVTAHPQYHVSGFRTEACADVKVPDEARSSVSRFFWKKSVYETQCWQLVEGSTLPEAEALSSLFRGAEIVVDLLGPVEREKTTVAEPQSPASQPTQSGTNAVPGVNPRETTYLP